MSSSTNFVGQKVFNAEQFKEHISTAGMTKLYFAYGKTDAWANDSVPNTAVSTVASQYEVWYNMIGGKQVTTADIAHVIPRNDWTTSTIYYAYDDKNIESNAKMYVLTSDWNVYKCIANNYGASSTVKPTAVNPDATTQTSDGYIWKYMYTVSDNEKLRFVTDNYIPVKTLTGDDGSRQWSVQEAAVDGGIHSILVTSSGSDYTSTPTVAITGDGSGATATATINTSSNTVNSIIVSATGQSYTYANVSITGGGGSGANARVIISPFGGHGSNPLYELGGKDLLVNPRLISSEDSVLPTTNDFRQVSLIRGPLIANSNTAFTNTAFLQAYTLITNTTGTGNYDENEIVYQGSSLAAASFSGRVVSWNATTATATTINNRGAPSAGSLIGANSATSRQFVSSNTGALSTHSGQVLYIDNIKPIIRSSDQTEDFKIIIKF